VDSLIVGSMGDRLGNPDFKVTLQFGSRQVLDSSTPDTFNWYTIYNCRRYQRESNRQTPGENVIAQTEASWEIWQSDLDAAGAPAPKTDDIIIDNTGTGWTFTDGHSTLLNGVFHLPARKATGYTAPMPLQMA
jgi:hypothetical protein